MDRDRGEAEKEIERQIQVKGEGCQIAYLSE